MFRNAILELGRRSDVNFDEMLTVKLLCVVVVVVGSGGDAGGDNC